MLSLGVEFQFWPPLILHFYFDWAAFHTFTVLSLWVDFQFCDLLRFCISVFFYSHFLYSYFFVFLFFLFLFFCLPILTRLDWELSDQWRQICIIAFYRKDLKPIKSWARTITWILLNLANTGCCWTCCWWCVILSIFRVIFMPIIVLLWSNWGLTEKKNFEPSDWW